MEAFKYGGRTTAAALAACTLALAGHAQVTQLVSIAADGTSPPNAGGSAEGVAISHDGRIVAFTSSAANLVQGDAHGTPDIFVRDRWLGTNELISISTTGTFGNAASGGPSRTVSISGDGRYVAFESNASNLVQGDTNGASDIFVRDRMSQTTELVSLGNSGNEVSDGCYWPSISDDGRYVVFQSPSMHLVANNTNGGVFLRDRQLGTTEIVSVSSSGVQADGYSYHASISGDGRYVAFLSTASNLVQVGTNGVAEVFVRDRQLGTTEIVSVSTTGLPAHGNNTAVGISSDGRYVAFASYGANLVPNDLNGSIDVFVRDRLLGTTELASVATNGAQGNSSSGSIFPISISSDGRFVAFSSFASNLVPGDTNNDYDVFVRDRVNGTTEIASVSTSGAPANQDSFQVAVSADGRFAAFATGSTNLVPGGTPFGGTLVRDRSASGATSLCDPGANGVIACPCANAPSGAGRGCDNSSLTGGASISASGFAYLSMDSLVFTTSNEKPTATSIVLQGNVLNASGIVFGQGVRCADGSLKRLYTQNASAGSITAPNLVGGDPTVSAQSSSLGDVISAGQSRWYLVYYRDPTVLGACPASSTFNATQTLRVDWSL
jgi:Tol biopolymer transport system component